MNHILNCLPSKKSDYDLTIGAIKPAIYKEPIPPSCDLRSGFGPIEDQGDTGSCVGQAVVSVLNWSLKNRSPWKNPIDQPNRSVRFIWQAAKELDMWDDRPTTFIEESGTSIKTALEVLKKFGCVPDEMLPFDGPGIYKGSESELFLEAAKNRIRDYVDLGRNQKDWRYWIATEGPIIICLTCDAAFVNCSKKGILKEYVPSNFGRHALVIAGFLRDEFILRNSWGTKWGDDGYAYASPVYCTHIEECWGIIL